MLIYLSMIEDDRSRERFISIYDQYKNLMFYAANRILQNEQDAEDAVHEAFLVVIRHLDCLWEDKGPYIKAFVLSIVENKAIDLWRRRQHLGEQVTFEDRLYAPAPGHEGNGLTEAIAKVARLAGVEENGFRILSNCGVHGCQSVHHLHVHLMGGAQLSEKMA